MLRQPEAPAPTAIASSEAKPITGFMCGASSMPTSAVNTTSDITRGFSSAKKSLAEPFEMPSAALLSARSWRDGCP